MRTATLADLASLVGAELHGDGAHVVCRVAPLLEAREDEVSFLGDPRYREHLAQSRAGAILVSTELAGDCAGRAHLVVDDPSAAISAIGAHLLVAPPELEEGIHPSAVVADTAEVGAGVRIGPQAVVGEFAVLGPQVQVHAGAVIGARVRVGARTCLHPRVVLYADVQVGEECILHAGAVVGADGFGFAPTESGWEPIPQVGTVVLGDRVELGANTCIDRARLGATRLGDGVKLDNLVHVAHNVQVGAHSLIVAQSGVAGSARLGQRVVLAGQVGINGHRVLGDGVRVGGKSAVFHDIPAGTEVLGIPATEKGAAIRNMRTMPRLHEMDRRLRALERRLAREEGEEKP